MVLGSFVLNVRALPVRHHASIQTKIHCSKIEFAGSWLTKIYLRLARHPEEQSDQGSVNW